MLTIAGWAVGTGCTVAILGTPYLRFGYHSPGLHLVLDSVDACIAMLLAYLVLGRFRRSHQVQDLLLAEGLLLLAMAGLGLAPFVDLLADEARQSFAVWLPLVLRTMAAVLFAVSAVTRGKQARPASTRLCVLGPAAVALAAALVLLVLRDALPVAASETAPTSAQRPVITGHPLLVAAQALSAGCFLFASLTFTLQAQRRADEVLRWLGPACALAGFARVNYVLFPSIYSGWLYTGDFLRTAGYACLLVGATREISRYWSAQTEIALMEDRRRLARELHDGVVQELAWIKSEARSMATARPKLTVSGAAAPLDRSSTQPIIDACDRALDEARAAVDVLGRDATEPLGYLLHRAAREVAERHGGHVVVELDDAVEAEQSQRHALARIVREAVGNALRHGAAQSVRIKLEVTPTGKRLVVQDDGRGFDVGSASAGAGFGLTSMRERAQGLPGAFDLRSTPDQGTTVEVTW